MIKIMGEVDDAVEVGQPAMQTCILSILSCLERHGWLAQASANVGVLTAIISGREIITDGKVGSNALAGISQRLALICGTSHLLGVAPHNLRKVAPGMEIAHVRVVLTIESFVSWSFIVVHAVGDHGRNFIGSRTGADVLAVALTVVILAFVGLPVTN